MLSIIICSVNPRYLAQVEENISSSIGVPYELLVWDNRVEKIGLCEVYNKMAIKTKFEYTCFLHEDILFQTLGWGKILSRIFEENPGTGVIGVAGGKYKSGMYSGWFTGNPDIDRYNIVHRTNGKDHKMVQPALNSSGIHEVVCIDGVFIACRSELLKKVGFDDQLLKGFHFYDIDFSLRAAQYCKVVVTLDIDIIHITQGGDYGDKWVNAAIQFHKAKSGLLPCFVKGIEKEGFDRFVANQWLDRLKNDKIAFCNRIRWITAQKLYNYPYLWYGVLKFLFYQPLHLHLIHNYLKKYNKSLFF